MSAKCKVCELPIFDEDAQCYGMQVPEGSGRWVCDDCTEYILQSMIKSEELTTPAGIRLRITEEE